MLQSVTARFGRIFRKRRRTEGLRAAVAVSDNEIAVALVRKLEGQRPKVLRIVVEEAPLGFADPVLKKIISEFDLRRVPVSAVINASDYQLAQVQAPDVPRAELRAAARYSMRDTFDFPIDHATLDVFDLPEQNSSGNKRMCFAVATRGDAIEKVTTTFERHFRRFDVIDIPELCQRNLASLLPQDAKGVAFLLIRDDFAQLVLTRRGMLYVTRRFDFGTRGELNGDADAEANELPLDPQMLSLELQRSLDYYESHFDETAIGELFIAPAGSRANMLAAELGASTGLRISMFNIHDLVDVSFSAEIPDGWLPCMAIGAAMRASGMSAAMQEVNLYQPVSKGVRGALSASSTLSILMLVSATLLGLWGFAYWQVGRLDTAAQLVRNQQQAQAALSAAQGPQLAGLSDEDLDAFLVRLGEDVDSKTRALAMLTSESQQQGFSTRLRAFGARHIDGIWLDRLTLGSTVESVSLSGSTLSPDVVPRYLRSLASDPALKGGQIDEFVIEKSPGRLMFRAGHQGLVIPAKPEEKS